MTTTLRPLRPSGTGQAGSAGQSRNEVYAVCANGRPIGSVRLSQQGVQGWISDLEVAPERRRRGHGSIAVLAAEEVLRYWGCRRVLVALPPSAVAAGALHEGLGYLLNRQVMVKRLGRRTPRLPPGLLVRPLRDEEYQDWLSRQVAAYTTTLVEYAGLTPAEAAQRAPQTMAALLPDGLASPMVLVRVLAVGGRRVGSVLVAFRAPDAPGRGWVYDLEVDPECRGRGYGRALMTVVEQECRSAGLREVGLNVYAGNTVAMGLYTSLGYRVDVRVLIKPL